MKSLNNDYIMPIVIGNYEVRIANSKEELLQAQKLRYQYLVKEYCPDDGSHNNGVNPTNSVAASEGIDTDDFDDYCSHLIVINHELKKAEQIIATYRLMRKQHKDMIGRWYSEAEFDLSNLKEFEPQILELGRATVHEDYRNNITLKLLWNGIAAFLKTYNLRYMIGTASFKGTEVNKVAEELSFLHHFFAMEDKLMAKAITSDAKNTDLISKDEVNQKQALIKLPPIIKGYLRTGGCFFSKTAFIDYPFGCIDILVFFDSTKTNEKYMNHFFGGKENNAI